MYIRRKVFSVLDTEAGERLFSTTDYILDQREFTGETKRRNKALKRQWLEKLGEADGDVLKDHMKRKIARKGKLRFINNNKIDLDAASKIRSGRLEYQSSQNSDKLAAKERLKRKNPEKFKASRKSEMISREIESWRNMINEPDPKPTTVVPEKALVVSNQKPVPQSPKPTTVVPEKALVVSNSKPAIKTESKLSKLAKNKYAKGAAGLLALGGTAAGGYYLLNKKKNKKDKEDKD